MTIVQSRLVGPDGSPVVGRHVYATLVGPAGWLAPDGRMAYAPVETVTDDAGMWRLDLVPNDRLEWGGHTKYRVVEGTHSTHYAIVPDQPGPVWLRDILTDEYAVTITWTPDPDDLLTVHLLCAGYGDSGCTLDLGDGATPIQVTALTPITHTYTAPDAHVVSGVDNQNPKITGTATVTVKDHHPKIHPFVDSDDPWECLLWIDEPADTTVYEINFGDGTPPVRHSGQNQPRVPPRPRVPHQYTAEGRYFITVTDLASKRQSTTEFSAGPIGMLITYDQADRARIDALWLASGATFVMARDGHTEVSGIVPPSGRVTGVGSHAEPGDHMLEVREIIGGQLRRSAMRRRIQPSQWDWRMDVDVTWRLPGDPPGRQTVTVTPKGARVDSIVEWGDNSDPTTVQPGMAVSHLYQLPAPPLGWRLRVTETGIADPRTWTRLLGEPRRVGEPTLSARTTGAVDMVIPGIPQDYNDDWCGVQWEEGGPVDPVGAVGRFYTANHVYNSPGHKKITVDGPGMPEPIHREITVVVYPSPVITVAEALDSEGKVLDPTRMTAAISVDNSASGGPSWVEFGDNTLPQLYAELDTQNHRYPAPGTYYIIASSKADDSAKGRMPVTVPFAATRTLQYEITGVTQWKVRCTITGKTPGKAIQIQWEAGADWVPMPPRDWDEHTYPSIEARYTITVAYVDGSESWSTTIPLPWEE